MHARTYAVGKRAEFRTGDQFGLDHAAPVLAAAGAMGGKVIRQSQRETQLHAERDQAVEHAGSLAHVGFQILGHLLTAADVAGVDHGGVVIVGKSRGLRETVVRYPDCSQ